MKETASEIATWVRNLSSTLEGVKLKYANEMARSILTSLREKSPVETGEFQRSWTVRPIGGEYSVGFIISNDTIQAGAIEYGSIPGSPPWPSPAKRTVQSAGRIWSSQAVGGVLNQVIGLRTSVIDLELSKFSDGITRIIK